MRSATLTVQTVRGSTACVLSQMKSEEYSGEMRSVSSETGVGLPEIYAAVQLQFHGGEDSGKDD